PPPAQSTPPTLAALPPVPFVTPPSPAAASPVSETQRRSRQMTVLSTGNVVVIDFVHCTLSVFTAEGQLRKQESFQAMPNLTPDDITFTQQGDVAYLFDAASQSLKVISLL